LPGIEAFEKNPQVQDAVVRNIEIIGEAANHINRMAPEFIAQHPELPWDDMRDMRNVVIHAYFAVDLQVVWRTVQEDLPKLKQQIDQLLSQPPRAPEPRTPLPMKAPVRADGGGDNPADADLPRHSPWLRFKTQEKRTLKSCCQCPDRSLPVHGSARL
jgi:uncharacterized protein with HEPN domain